MSSKDKDKTMDKLKQFFRLNKGNPGNYKGKEDFVLSPEIEKEISPESSMNHRIKAIKELSEHVLNHKLEDNAVEKLWTCLQDLLLDNVAQEHRHLAFSFLRNLVAGQYDRLNLMRVKFFQLIKTHENSEDVGPRLDLLSSLTDSGRDILYLEEEIGPFLLTWMSVVVEAGRSTDLLSMFVNIIKYNAAYIDEEIIHGLVQNTCFLCIHTPLEQVVFGCLDLLDTIICYSNLPPESLPTFITALCHTVNIEVYCIQSTRIMRHVMGTHMGHSSISTMTNILKDKNSLQEPGLIRGAIFYITMGLWGNSRIQSLKYSPTAIVPAFRMALESNHPVVMYEVMLSIQWIVKRLGNELYDPCWNMCLSMIDTILDFVDVNTTTLRMPAAQISTTLHDTLNMIERLIETNQFNGKEKQFYEIIVKCSSKRPESSVLRLINYLSASITPIEHKWMDSLYKLVERYYKYETRPNIRIKTIDILSSMFQLNKYFFEKEMLEKVILVHLYDSHLEQDRVVRTAVAQFLVDLSMSLHHDSVHLMQVMDIIEKMLTEPFNHHDNLGASILTEQDSLDMKTLIHGMIKMFTTIMFRSSAIKSVRAYQILVNHLELHYSKPSILEQVPSIRSMVFECLLKLRADSEYRLGFPDETTGKPKFSSFLIVEYRALPPSPIPVSCYPYYISLSSACKVIVTGLKQEQDWKVLLLILQEVPQVMKNRALILSKQSHDVDSLAAALCSMVTEKCLVETLHNTPPKFTRSDFQSYVFPVLAALASHHAQLDPSIQQRLIKCLEFGLASRSVRQCVIALTVCTLEMRDTMVKLLPEVLLNLSKITSTIHIAIPMLEFLSTLTRLPEVFSSFVGDQYMSVFAISLPYTNPFKYNHYTVSLAHHVIAVWFLKCRLPFRKDFVKFIIKGLRTNAIQPFEEDQRIRSEYVNEDSSNRKRSSSLTEQGSRRKPEPKPQNQKLMAFHRELTETCVDLMVRYTYSTCSSMPKRLPSAEFLLSGGQSMTWLLGNKLITITTSGCFQKPLKTGLCDRCMQVCRLGKDTNTSPASDYNPDSDRRTQSSKHAPLSRSTSVDITPQSSSMFNSSTSTSSPSEDTRKGFDFGSSESEASKIDDILRGLERREPQLCACWCQGWAEIYIRRPTGDMSWAMRLQNQPQTLTSPTEFPLNDIATLMFPSLNKKSDLDLDFNLEMEDEGLNTGVTRLSDLRQISDPVSIPRSPAHHSSKDSVEIYGDDPDFDDERSGRSRNPVRRSNSSPEMSSSWKNPFHTGAVGGLGNVVDDLSGRSESNIESKKKTVYSKDMRGNCEAIPEEIGGLGNTPPSAAQSVLSTIASNVLKKPDLSSLTGNVKITDARGSTDSLTKKSCDFPTQNVTTNSSSIKTVEKPSLAATIKSSTGSDSGCFPSLSSSNTELSSAGSKVGFMPLNPTPPHLTSKPPLSPPPSQMSPRFQPKITKDQESSSKIDPLSLPPPLLPLRRDRCNTISVMSPAMRKPRIDWESSSNKSRNTRSKEQPRSGVNPSVVFLQLYHNACFGNGHERPLMISNSPAEQRSIKNLDWIKPYETHKIGVLYVGPGQANSETSILRNSYGSVRYSTFLQNIGTFIKLSELPEYVFLGGLDRHGNDGLFSYMWEDDVMQVIFHIATLMPLKESDPQCNGKKLHIGNDYVNIVYNESGEDYNIRTVKGQFNYACIVIQPLEHNCNEVTVKTREELVELIGHTEPKIVSDKNVAILARQLALHANLASMVSRSLNMHGSEKGDPYASNWLERLRQIKRIRNKAMQELQESNGGPNSGDIQTRQFQRNFHMDDFTEYT